MKVDPKKVIYKPPLMIRESGGGDMGYIALFIAIVIYFVMHFLA